MSLIVYKGHLYNLDLPPKTLLKIKYQELINKISFFIFWNKWNIFDFITQKPNYIIIGERESLWERLVKGDKPKKCDLLRCLNMLHHDQNKRALIDLMFNGISTLFEESPAITKGSLISGGT